MTPAVAVGICFGITGTVVTLCFWMLHDADKRMEIGDELLSQADARAARLQATVNEQAQVIEPLRAHLADTSDGWVTYQRSRGYRAPTAVQVIKVWEN